ncbi:hypothetical protein D9M71_531780 [compost metagenome]
MCAKLVSGPKLVFSSCGLPMRMRFTRSSTLASKRACSERGMNTRVPLVQTWPELKKLAMTAMSAARSRLASSKMISGDLPPSSMVTSFSEELEALAMTFLPVEVPPVKEIFSICGCSVSHWPTSRPLPVRTLNTPSGTPASV